MEAVKHAIIFSNILISLDEIQLFLRSFEYYFMYTLNKHRILDQIFLDRNETSTSEARNLYQGN